jgi:hypothetical protein
VNVRHAHAHANLICPFQKPLPNHAHAHTLTLFQSLIQQPIRQPGHHVLAAIR